MITLRSKNLEQAANLFHALSDGTRLRILQQLQGGEHCVCDLTDAFQTGQSRLSFHLKVLKEAGLVLDRRDGRWMYYSLNPEGLNLLEEFLRLLRTVSKAPGRSTCCG
ncbi:MAG: helix-turn-helix transcriptional regulator [Nitrospira sp.]|uniref:Arsenical resistance operon repressor n=1 Tax=Nitrospira defluvii TaxID=330214 RepID=A0ABM8R067_9BACT|nr:metalloregulator ArsR/SmtB family transcription factor [Nitrospira defluvii]MCS6328441.1 helix-turn-helix transcriptional regulator [Nitrospira sp.]CAE6725658.1 Arsenical resistance operon repressor [Nitrospira defluvii]